MTWLALHGFLWALIEASKSLTFRDLLERTLPKLEPDEAMGLRDGAMHFDGSGDFDYLLEKALFMDLLARDEGDNRRFTLGPNASSFFLMAQPQKG